MAESKLIANPITRSIIGAAIEVHRCLGPGLLEGVYQACLVHELRLRDLKFQTEVAVPVVYKGVHLDCGHRIDIWVENQVILELKSVEEILPVHEAQLLTYLKLTGCKVGLLINFNVPILIDGIRRLVN